MVPERMGEAKVLLLNVWAKEITARVSAPVILGTVRVCVVDCELERVSSAPVVIPDKLKLSSFVTSDASTRLHDVSRSLFFNVCASVTKDRVSLTPAKFGIVMVDAPTVCDAVETVKVCPLAIERGDEFVSDKVELIVGAPANVYVPVAVPERTGLGNVLFANDCVADNVTSVSEISGTVKVLVVPVVNPDRLNCTIFVVSAVSVRDKFAPA